MSCKEDPFQTLAALGSVLLFWLLAVSNLLPFEPPFSPPFHSVPYLYAPLPPFDFGVVCVLAWTGSYASTDQ